MTPLPYVGYGGCNLCGTRWSASVGPDCWMCGLPGQPVLVVTISSQNGSGYTGCGVDIQAAIRAGADLSCDPCGGGPIR